MKLRICCGPRCTDHGSQYIVERAEGEKSLGVDVEIETCGCMGHCEKGANVVVNGDMKHNMTSAKMGSIIDKEA